MNLKEFRINMILPIYKMGSECLKIVSTEVEPDEFGSEALDQLIQNMHETLIDSGGVGLAAPQIGVNKRILLIEYTGSKITRYSDIGDCALKVIINPKIEFIGNEYTAFNEGCLSLPNLRGEVIRPKALKYSYFDQFGKQHSGEDNAFFARVLQHELDHLDGILYPIRMHDISKLSYADII